MTRLLAGSDVRLGFRLMRQQPVLAAAAVLALATGIGMATTGFAFLEAVLLARLPFPDGDRFVLLEAYADPEARRQPLGSQIASMASRPRAERFTSGPLARATGRTPSAQTLTAPLPAT
jgi:hypothetical protein